ncbi:hypothetical protein PYCCODRAFT_312087 [Trametes coccinea BRFM310]|uniref:Uncharacterized protein n=1 Tax=Trametes coccinea (strain BRFM310) TaxID=1353009 RepID=A0A1Y2INZ2_TRAC3|nr:hypothetical protein PYCCODRAFT_312087 [Trametes coccinea BRFM310]
MESIPVADTSCPDTSTWSICADKHSACQCVAYPALFHRASMFTWQFYEMCKRRRVQPGAGPSLTQCRTCRSPAEALRNNPSRVLHLRFWGPNQCFGATPMLDTNARGQRRPRYDRRTRTCYLIPRSSKFSNAHSELYCRPGVRSRTYYTAISPASQSVANVFKTVQNWQIGL